MRFRQEWNIASRIREDPLYPSYKAFADGRGLTIGRTGRTASISFRNVKNAITNAI